MNVETMKKIVTASKISSSDKLRPSIAGVYIKKYSDGFINIIATNGNTAVKIKLDDSSVRYDMFFSSSSIPFLKGIVKTAEKDGIKTIPPECYLGVNSICDIEFPFIAIDSCVNQSHKDTIPIRINASMLYDLAKSMQSDNKNSAITMRIPTGTSNIISVENRGNTSKGVIAQIV